MSHKSRPFLLFAMLLAIGLRSVFGAPCCVDMAHAASPEHVEASEHSHHDADHESAGGHNDHGEGPTSNPCCSACGPTLPPELATFAVVLPPRALPEPMPVRALATRPPYPAYDATGPPLLI